MFKWLNRSSASSSLLLFRNVIENDEIDLHAAREHIAYQFRRVMDLVMLSPTDAGEDALTLKRLVDSLTEELPNKVANDLGLTTIERSMSFRKKFGEGPYFFSLNFLGCFFQIMGQTPDLEQAYSTGVKSLKDKNLRLYLEFKGEFLSLFKGYEDMILTDKVSSDLSGYMKRNFGLGD